MEWNIGTVIDVVIAVSFLAALVRGWQTGLAIKIGQFVALVLSVVSAKLVSGGFAAIIGKKIVLPYLEKQTDTKLQEIPFVEEGIETAAEAIAGHILFFVFFVVILFVLRKLIGILHIIDYIPVVNTINGIGGALVSLFITFVVFFLFGAIASGVLEKVLTEQFGLTETVIENTVFLKLFWQK